MLFITYLFPLILLLTVIKVVVGSLCAADPSIQTVTLYPNPFPITPSTVIASKSPFSSSIRSYGDTK